MQVILGVYDGVHINSLSKQETVDNFDLVLRDAEDSDDSEDEVLKKRSRSSKKVASSFLAVCESSDDEEAEQEEVADEEGEDEEAASATEAAELCDGSEWGAEVMVTPIKKLSFIQFFDQFQPPLKDSKLTTESYVGVIHYICYYYMHKRQYLLTKFDMQVVRNITSNKENRSHKKKVTFRKSTAMKSLFNSGIKK